MSKQKLTETASGGAVGAGGIAVRTDGPGLADKEGHRLQDFLRKFNKRVVNSWKFKEIKTPFPIKVTEGAFDLQDVLSRLRGIEGRASDVSASDTVTYGVEDDEGNIMKVTVRKNQSAEFEAVLANELAEIEAFSVTGNKGKDVSMAELLYNLKDKFDIIDVEFPKIPTDVVYNADKATYKVNDDVPSTDPVEDDQTNLDANGELDDPIEPVMDANKKLDLNDISDEDELPSTGNNSSNPLDTSTKDADNVEEFSEPEGGTEGSILDKVLSMLKAQAEAEAAKANAEAEKYRADQAEYSARAASATIAQQEELARMEAELEKQKNEQKEAKKLADIAKFRVQKASQFVNEADSGETSAMVRKMLSMLPQKWAVSPNDDPETRTYKTRQLQNETRELQARMRTARTREIRAAELARQGKVENSKDQQQTPNNQTQSTKPGSQEPV